MKFLVDAHLPKRLAHYLTHAGHDALHTLDLPAGNDTPDYSITVFADADKRTIITKDSDFVTSHILYERLATLLLLSTGNVVNQDLIGVFDLWLGEIVVAFEDTDFVELSRSGLILHR